MLSIPTALMAGIALAGLALLVASIERVLRLVRGSVVARLPALIERSFEAVRRSRS